MRIINKVNCITFAVIFDFRLVMILQLDIKVTVFQTNIIPVFII